MDPNDTLVSLAKRWALEGPLPTEVMRQELGKFVIFVPIKYGEEIISTIFDGNSWFDVTNTVLNENFMSVNEYKEFFDKVKEVESE